MKKTVKTTRPAKTAAAPAPPKAGAPLRATNQSETPASPPPKKRAAPRKTAAKTKPVLATPAPTASAPPPTAPKPEAPAKLPIPGGAPLKPTPPATLIHAQIDVGFGNTLHIRGDGPGLSWHGGLAMVPVAANLWSFTVRGATAPFAFKVLVNDLTWNEGENYLIAPGTEITVMPVFP
jgi:hypothetical protein